MKPAAYPIIPIIENTVQEGDSVKVVAVRQKNDEENLNFDTLKEELKAINLPNCELIDLTMLECQDRDELVVLYEQLINCIENNACYYACATFGTKTFPLVLFSALRFADRLYPQTEIKGIYYREVLRTAGKAQKYRMYDINVLFTLDGIVDLAATNGVDDPKTFMHLLLHPNSN